MKPFLVLLGAMIGLVSCGATGPVIHLQDKLPDWVFLPETVDRVSDNEPSMTDTVVTFQVPPGQRRSALQTAENWRIGQSYLFGFDIRLDPEVLSQRPVTVSRLSRVTKPQSELVSVTLDPRQGVTVFGRSCIRPEHLSDWHRVEMRIRISNDDKGFLEVFCDRKPIWAQKDIRTTFPPVCRLSEGCIDDVAKPARFKWHIGLLSDEALSKHAEIQMRRLHQRVIFYIPNRAGTL